MRANNNAQHCLIAVEYLFHVTQPVRETRAQIINAQYVFVRHGFPTRSVVRFHVVCFRILEAFDIRGVY
jgi:hypothetical protein